jgi:hypothetical protein
MGLLFGCKTPKKLFGGKNIAVDLCSHRWGMDMSFTQTSDRHIPNELGNSAEFYGLKYNIPLTVFVSDGNISLLSDAFQMGRMDVGVYVNSCDSLFVKNVRQNVLKNIDFVSRVRNGARPSVLSYGCGDDSYSEKISDLFLMGRNSLSTNDAPGFTYYGLNLGFPSDSVLSRSLLLSRPSASRYFLMLKNKSLNPKESIQNKIIETNKSNGFYTDFCHWHAYKFYNWVRIKDLMEHFSNISTVLDTCNVYRGSYNQIAEYYFAREAVDEIKAFKKKKSVIVEVSYSKKENIDYSLISAPVSIELDLNEQRLSNYNYLSVKGGKIRKLASGNLILDMNLDFSKENNVLTDTLFVTDMPGYLDFTIPTIQIINNVFRSNQEIKLTIFQKPINSDDTKIAIYKRYLDFRQEHILPEVDRNGFEYHIGYINETNNSGLIKWDL